MTSPGMARMGKGFIQTLNAKDWNARTHRGMGMAAGRKVKATASAGLAVEGKLAFDVKKADWRRALELALKPPSLAVSLARRRLSMIWQSPHPFQQAVAWLPVL